MGLIKVNTFTKGTQTDDQRKAWGQKKFVSRDNLKGFLENGTLHIHILARVFGKLRLSEQTGDQVVDAGSGPRNFASDLRTVYESGEGTDVTLRAGDAQLSAHSFVLSIRSPVFKGMLSGAMREAKTGVVDLQTDELTAKKFLDFVYLDKLDASANEAPDLCCHLLKLAHQFEVLGLVDQCTAALKGGLEVGSALERLMLADELGLQDLRSACVNFLTLPGNLEAAQASEAWERLVEQRPRLMADLLKTLKPPTRKRPRDAQVDYHSWSKADLVSEARRRNLATSGNKQDLVDRLATAAIDVD